MSEARTEEEIKQELAELIAQEQPSLPRRIRLTAQQRMVQLRQQGIIGIPGPAAGPRPGTPGSALQREIQRRIDQQEADIRKAKKLLADQAASAEADAREAKRKGQNVQAGLLLGIAQTFKAAIGFVEGFTFFVRPGAAQQTASSLVALATDQAERQKAVEQIQADPLGAITIGAGALVGAGQFQAGASELAARTQLVQQLAPTDLRVLLSQAVPEELLTQIDVATLTPTQIQMILESAGSVQEIRQILIQGGQLVEEVVQVARVPPLTTVEEFGIGLTTGLVTQEFDVLGFEERLTSGRRVSLLGGLAQEQEITRRLTPELQQRRRLTQELQQEQELGLDTDLVSGLETDLVTEQVRTLLVPRIGRQFFETPLRIDTRQELIGETITPRVTRTITETPLETITGLETTIESGLFIPTVTRRPPSEEPPKKKRVPKKKKKKPKKKRKRKAAVERRVDPFFISKKDRETFRI